MYNLCKLNPVYPSIHPQPTVGYVHGWYSVALQDSHISPPFRVEPSTGHGRTARVAPLVVDRWALWRIRVRQLEVLAPTYGKTNNVPNHPPDWVMQPISWKKDWDTGAQKKQKEQNTAKCRHVQKRQARIGHKQARWVVSTLALLVVPRLLQLSSCHEEQGWETGTKQETVQNQASIVVKCTKHICKSVRPA